MAYDKIIPIKRRLDHCVNYVLNPKKTDLGRVLKYIGNADKTVTPDGRAVLETAINCQLETAYREMQDTKKRWAKQSGVLGYHLVHSYAPGEVTPEQAHATAINELYECESTNPQQVTVGDNMTATVSFYNRLHCGSIAVQKVDTSNAPRAGAEFLLEWSEDNVTWQSVTCADAANPVKGGCTSGGLTEGRLVSGEDGMVRFEGLCPELYYRLTETKAPDGLQLLADYAFEGQLPKDKELTVSLRVVNAPAFTLPQTGSNTAVLLPIGLILCLAAYVEMFVCLRRKKQ